MTRCPECRTRRATYAAMQDHIRASEHRVCTCEGYHYAHRPGSPCCEHHRDASVHRAIRAGDTEARILLPGIRSLECPF